MSPLAKRLPRELKHNLGKYLGIFLLMCSSIALTSGFLLAAHSIDVIMEGMRDEYVIEDGRFTLAFKATNAQLDAAEDAAGSVGGMNVYENFSIDATVTAADLSDASRHTLRTSAHRTQVDLAAYCEGEAPEADDEVAVDRVFAKNNNVQVGDTVELCGRAFRVCGIMTQPDSQALFQNNSDFTVNTLTYGVAEVSEAGFAALEQAGGSAAYTYSYVFCDRDLSLAARTDAEKDIARALADADANVTDLLDADANQGIGYAAEDVKSDSSLWEVLLEIIIAIMAFIFVVLTSATIEEESAVIGTLLASGYRSRELIASYLAMPTLVGTLAALVGFSLGITVFTGPMQSLYYGSYSLPPFHVTWDWAIFAETVVAPVAVLVLITLAGLLCKMGKTPLQFLRREAGGKAGTRRGVALPERLGFVARFRIRVFLRNLGNFATLFIGCAFASLLLIFGLAITPTMQQYADNLKTSLASEHLYTLKAPLELDGTEADREAWAAAGRLMDIDAALLTAAEDAADELEDAADAAQDAVAAAQASPSADTLQEAQDSAERATDAREALYERLDRVAAALGCDRDEAIELIDKASGIDADDEDAHPVNTAANSASAIAQAEKLAVRTLQYKSGDGDEETVTVYGIQKGSAYWEGLGIGDGRAVMGAGLIDKFGWKEGQAVTFTDKYEDVDHELTYEGADAVWGNKSNMNVYLSLDDFNELFGNDAAYFNAYASDEELALDSRYLAGDTTPSDMQAIGDQFVKIMGSITGMMVGLSVLIFVLFMYLLTKAVLDRSARAISYMKVFGYRDGEISLLYLRSITICVVVSLIVTQPAVVQLLTVVYRAMLSRFSGNLEMYVPPLAIAASLAAGLASYLAVAALHLRQIRRVPLSEALKAQE